MLPATPLDCPIAFLDCQRTAATLMIATSDQQIVLWDLENLREKERMSLVTDDLPEIQRNEAPIDVRFDRKGSVVVQFRTGLYVYCPSQQKWIETDTSTPNQSHQTESTNHNTRMLSLYGQSSSDKNLVLGDRSWLRSSLPDRCESLPEAIPTKITDIEVSFCRALAQQESKALHLASIHLAYCLLDLFSSRSKWTGRKLLFLVQTVMTSSKLFPSSFRRLFLNEIWFITSSQPDVFRPLQMDIMILICSTDAS